MQTGYRHLFGPVRSRRLGRSLGIDLVPHKVCTFDCPYCQVGATTEKTLDRREYAPVPEVLAEFDHWLVHGGGADVVTLAGNGEPTLHVRFGDVLREVATRCTLKRALLSNGSLFHLPQVRADARHADIVKGTLGAWDARSFTGLHHPHPGLTFDAHLEGLRAMRREFSGDYWIEVFLVPGLNDETEAVRNIAALVRDLRPDHVHLNSAVRPAQDRSVQPLSIERLQELAALFTPVAEVSAAAAPAIQAPAAGDSGVALEARVLALLQRHPSRREDIPAALGVTAAAGDAVINRLLAARRIRWEPAETGDFLVTTGP
jgi:wyosine [tRNA(Phe)-imidazoG37] synthetase (radical SAM superfamily)